MLYQGNEKPNGDKYSCYPQLRDSKWNLSLLGASEDYIYQLITEAKSFLKGSQSYRCFFIIRNQYYQKVGLVLW